MMHKSCDHAGRFMLCNVIKTMSFRMAPGTVLSVNFYDKGDDSSCQLL
jgi:hypothetical protein